MFGQLSGNFCPGNLELPMNRGAGSELNSVFFVILFCFFVLFLLVWVVLVVVLVLLEVVLEQVEAVAKPLLVPVL